MSEVAAAAGAGEPERIERILDWPGLLSKVDAAPGDQTPSRIAGFTRDQIGSQGGRVAATAPHPVMAAAAGAVFAPHALPPVAGAQVESASQGNGAAEGDAVHEANRQAVSEIAQMLRKSTKSTDPGSFFTSLDPMTNRTEIRWSRVAPLILVGVFVFYGALRLYASPAADAGQKTAATDVGDERAAKDGPEGTLPEESLFAPRSKYEVAGREEKEEGEPPPEKEQEQAEPAPARSAGARTETVRPAPPASWQAALLMDMPAEEEYVGEEEAATGLGIVLREGTRIPATLVGTLASSYESPVQARLDEDFMEGGLTVLPRGTVLLGKTQANVTQKRIYVRFHRAVLPTGAAIEIVAAAQNADLSTGLVADRIEKHRSRNIIAGTLATVAGAAGRIVGVGGAAANVPQAAARQVAGEARASIEPKATLYVNAGRRIVVYLEADVAL